MVSASVGSDNNMKIEIKMFRPDVCDECPLLSYKEIGSVIGLYSRSFVVTCRFKYFDPHITNGQGSRIRPQKCIDDCGL